MNCTVSLSLLYSWQEAKSRFLSSQLNPGHGHATSSTAPSHDTQGRVYPSKHSLQNDGQTLQTHPPTSPPPPPAFPPLLTIFWALAVSLRKAPDSRRARSWEKWRLSTRRLPEYTWLMVTSVLYPGQKEMGYQGSMSKSLLPLSPVTPTLSVSPESCASKAALLALCSVLPIRQVIQGSPQCILSICCVGHSGNGKRDK